MKTIILDGRLRLKEKDQNLILLGSGTSGDIDTTSKLFSVICIITKMFTAVSKQRNSTEKLESPTYIN